MVPSRLERSQIQILFLKVELKGFANGLDVGYKRGKNDSKVFSADKWKKVQSYTEMHKTKKFIICF